MNANTRRCHNCYVALEAASRPPSPLRAAPSAPLGGSQLALAMPGLTPPALAEPPLAASLIAVHARPDEQLLAAGVRCRACESTVMPVTGWCSFCMEPLPPDVSPLPASVSAVNDFNDFDLNDFDFNDFDDFERGLSSREPGGQLIPGPWPDRPVGVTYATWRRRAVAASIDCAVFVPFLVALAFSTAIGLVLLVAAVAFSGWQMSALQGRTGQTIGKNRVGIFLVQESNLAPIGARRAALRQLAHGIDAALLGVGLLWPLWDGKHRTFADQLFGTVVVAG
ncbi:MAG: RDD family protein [Actinomycetota bacterium]|nr:RDD family protein [Actinomycetota bacterium]